MATQILAIASGAANSADVVVAAGTPLTVCLKDGAAPRADSSSVRILLKDDGGVYWGVDWLTTGKPALVISGAGTYRFSRVSGTCGVFSG